MTDLCELAGVSRSGYYDWKKRDRRQPADRQRVLALVKQCHEEHPSHGYRWVHAWIVQHNDDVKVSADYVRKAFSHLGIRSETKHKAKRTERKVKDPYPNLVFSTWDTVDRPRQVIVSDMTAFYGKWSAYWELTLCFDVFTKQIVGRGLTRRRGWPGQYYEARDQMAEKVAEHARSQVERGDGDVTVFHTDQGSVYTSMSYNELIKESNIVRSCSRAGKPTDNPVNESLNGWIKEELFVDFGLADCEPEDVPDLIDAYIEYYNAERPCYSLDYMTPDAFYAAFMAGDIERRDTFKDRVLDPTPKFVRKRKKDAGEGDVDESGA